MASIEFMDRTKFDGVAEPLAKEADLGTAYAAELDAAVANLHAQRSDLEQLIGPISAKHVSRRQIPGLLKQAFLRLTDLRDSQSDFTRLASRIPEITILIEQANTALQTGEPFSLDDTELALEQAYKRCLELDGEAETAAPIRSRQACVVAIKQELRRAAELFAQAAATPGLDVVQQWQYQSKRARALEDFGREFKDNPALEEAVELYETTIVELAPRNERPGDWAITQNGLGNALGILGQRQRGTHMLEASIAAFENALAERDRELVPLDWAATQNDLGNAFGILGQRQGDTEMLEQSVAAFEAALEERTRERVPQDWATTQNNLGAALQTLGGRQDGTKLLSKSVKAYKNVLQEWTFERVPLDWATTLNNLGGVLRILGERQSGTRTLEKSVAAYKNALKVRTRERLPQDWAMTQNNLGAALQKLGASQDDGANTLVDSIAAYENTLKEWTRELQPMGWVMTMANLGSARRDLAERSMDVEIARMAITDFEAVVQFFRDAGRAQYHELGEEQLAKAKTVMEGISGA